MSKKIDVLLLGMPFSYFSKPLIGLSLLKSGLNYINISSKVIYFSLKFVKKYISPELNNLIANNYPTAMCLLGDWIFSKSKKNYIKDILSDNLPDYEGIKIPEYNIKEIEKVRRNNNIFLEECLEEVLSFNPTLVGFTSHYGQQGASLALAEMIKKRNSKIHIIFGGPNCEGIMGAELIRQFTFIDSAVSGEGDIVFPEIVKLILKKKSISHLQGVYTRDNISKIFKDGNFKNSESVNDMDSLPYADYEDFICQWNESPFSNDRKILENILLMPMLLFETSRGCWWGQKKRCNFCGYGQSINFRSKTPERALKEFNHIIKNNHGYPVVNVDNILNINYFEKFLSKITSTRLALHHVKANLTKEHLKLIKEKVHPHLQPGIESLSTPVLKLMRKGTTALQNIQFLKWSQELGIHISWNLLYGFPGEEAKHYKEIADLIPLISHLQPPYECSKIYISRFSPYFEESEKLGLKDVLPYPAYNYIYPEISPKAIKNLAFYFTYKYQKYQDVNNYIKPVLENFNYWLNNHASSFLTFREHRYKLIISDSRPIAQKKMIILSELESTIYLACDKIQSLDNLKIIVEKETGTEPSEKDMDKILLPLLRKKLMLKENDKYLSLATKAQN